jgi:hypothetical protein
LLSFPYSLRDFLTLSARRTIEKLIKVAKSILGSASPNPIDALSLTSERVKERVSGIADRYANILG